MGTSCQAHAARCRPPPGLHPEARSRPRSPLLRGHPLARRRRTTPNSRFCSASATRTIRPSKISSGCSANSPRVPISLPLSPPPRPTPKPACWRSWRATRATRCWWSTTAISQCAGLPGAVTAPLADPRVGLVTCLYRAAAESPAARLEALGIATEFAPSVLVARLLGVAEFALGSTMALRAETLREIGGFEAIAGYLADDYQLGSRISQPRLPHSICAAGGGDQPGRGLVGRRLAPPGALVAHHPRFAALRLLRIRGHARHPLGAGGLRRRPMEGRGPGAGAAHGGRHWVGAGVLHDRNVRAMLAHPSARSARLRRLAGRLLRKPRGLAGIASSMFAPMAASSRDGPSGRAGGFAGISAWGATACRNRSAIRQSAGTAGSTVAGAPAEAGLGRPGGRASRVRKWDWGRLADFGSARHFAGSAGCGGRAGTCDGDVPRSGGGARGQVRRRAL